MRERVGVGSSDDVRLRAGATLVDVDGEVSSFIISPRKGGTFSLFPSPPKPVNEILGRFGLGVASGVGGSQTVLVDAGDEISE